MCRSPLRYPVASVVLPALEGMAQQLQLGSLAAAVQAVPGLRAVVHQAANALRSQIPRPPLLPTDWNRRAQASLVRCGAARCADCPAVRAFLENAQQSEQRFVMGATRRKHLSRLVGGWVGGWCQECGQSPEAGLLVTTAIAAMHATTAWMHMAMRRLAVAC